MTTDRVVIDASVAIAFLREEVHSQRVRTALAGWAAHGATLLVPAHFWLELANVLIRRRALSPAEALEGLLELDRLGLQTVETDRPTLLLAMDQMARFGLSAYDAINVAVALSSGSQLATLDARLAAAAGERGLLLSDEQPGRLSESAALYRESGATDPGWAHSAVVCAEMARLRRELATA